MKTVVIFGGTSEGRMLCEALAAFSAHLIYSVVSAEGAAAVRHIPHLNVRVGPLDEPAMSAFFETLRPALAVDATHPYAMSVSETIKSAAEKLNIPVIRVKRENEAYEGEINLFSTLDDLLHWLEKTPGTVFVTLGSSYASNLSCLPDFTNRLWLRILPAKKSLTTCLDAGFFPEKIIAMQGPFSKELNITMFKHTKADILVTKMTGKAGGYDEKLEAAKELGLTVAVLKNRQIQSGLTQKEAVSRIVEVLQ